MGACVILDSVFRDNLRTWRREDLFLFKNRQILVPKYLGTQCPCKGQATNLLDVWQEAIVAPTRVSQFGPAIKIRLGASIKDHAVQLRRTTNNLALGDRHCAILQLWVCRIGYVPVIFCTNCSASHSRNRDKVFVVVAKKKRGLINTSAEWEISSAVF